MGETDLESQRELAAAMFPMEWAATLRAQYGEQRRRRQKSLRDRAVYATRLAPLKASGATCATCKHRGKAEGVKGPICDAKSDFHGYQTTTMDGLCADWETKP